MLGGHPYVRHEGRGSHTPVFVKNKILDLDPWALDPQSSPNL